MMDKTGDARINTVMAVLIIYESETAFKSENVGCW